MNSVDSEKTNFHTIARELIEAARLAPSSHNSQPWLFRISKDSIEVWGSEKRRLPGSDQNDRQLFISLGCAIENLCVAAEHFGFDADVVYLPDATRSFFAARLDFRKKSSDDADTSVDLFSSIPKRHTNRGSLAEDGAIDVLKNALEKISSNKEIRIDFIEDEKKKKEIAFIVEEATRAAFHDKGFTKELGEWIKPSLKKYQDGMPGYNLEIPFPISFIMPFAMRHVNMANAQHKMVRKMLAYCPVYLIISASEDTPLYWMKAGRAVERLWLMATQKGLGIGPLAAPINIQEFYKDIQEVMGFSFRPLFFGRIGKPVSVPPKSPRLDIEKIIISN